MIEQSTPSFSEKGCGIQEFLVSPVGNGAFLVQKLQKYSAVMQRSKGILFILKFSRKTEILFMDEVLGEAVGISWDPMVWIIIVEFWTNLLHTIDYLL